MDDVLTPDVLTEQILAIGNNYPHAKWSAEIVEVSDGPAVELVAECHNGGGNIVVMPVGMGERGLAFAARQSVKRMVAKGVYPGEGVS